MRCFVEYVVRELAEVVVSRYGPPHQFDGAMPILASCKCGTQKNSRPLPITWLLLAVPGERGGREIPLAFNHGNAAWKSCRIVELVIMIAVLRFFLIFTSD